jgi:membrane protein involved in colicin uptake
VLLFYVRIHARTGPAKGGVSDGDAVMSDEGDAARKARKLRASRDRWKQRSAEKQKQIRQLRVTNRDLSTSRDQWKARVKELEQQLRAVQAAAESPSADGPAVHVFFGGQRVNRSMTLLIPLSLLGD